MPAVAGVKTAPLTQPQPTPAQPQPISHHNGYGDVCAFLRSCILGSRTAEIDPLIAGVSAAAGSVSLTPHSTTGSDALLGGDAQFSSSFNTSLSNDFDDVFSDSPVVLTPLRPENASGLGRSPPGSPREPLLLPSQQLCDKGKLTVVFDLDETLVQNRFSNGGPFVERPHLREMLEALGKRCELVLWTASTEKIASPIVRCIDPNGTAFRHCIYRDSRWFPEDPTKESYTKDLRRLGRNMASTMIVENSPDCVVRNPANAIMVNDFLGTDLKDPSLCSVRRVIDEVADELASDKTTTVAKLLCASPHLVPRVSKDPQGQTHKLQYVSTPDGLAKPLSSDSHHRDPLSLWWELGAGYTS